MNTFISIVEKQFTQDDEGFKTETDVTVAEVRAYRYALTGKAGMAVRNGPTWLPFPPPPTFSNSA